MGVVVSVDAAERRWGIDGKHRNCGRQPDQPCNPRYHCDALLRGQMGQRSGTRGGRRQSGKADTVRAQHDADN